MNGKQAKRLRSIGDAMATMAPDHKRAKLYKVQVREVVVGHNSDGTQKTLPRTTGVLFNNAATARAIYQKAKARFKRIRKDGLNADIAAAFCASLARVERDKLVGAK